MAACELTGCKLVFLYFLLQIPLKVPMNAMRVNGPSLEHGSVYRIHLLHRTWLLITGYKAGKSATHIVVNMVDPGHPGPVWLEHL